MMKQPASTRRAEPDGFALWWLEQQGARLKVAP
jgi:hypothetical protein